MAVVQMPRKRLMRTYDGPSYVPASIDTYVATGQRKMPWSVLGTDLDQTTGMTAADALAAIDMDVEITKQPLAFIQPDGTTQHLPGWNATGIVDKATGKFDPWGFPVSDGYTIVQPAEGLGFIDQMLHDHKGAHYSTAWSMREKRMLGVTVEFPEHIVVDPGGAADTLGIYGLGVNSFDGSAAFRFSVTTVRFWCMNQLNPALGRQAMRSISMKHTRGITGRVQEAREALGLTLAYAGALDEAANALYAQAFTDRQFANIVKDVFPITPEQPDRTRARMGANRDAMMELWMAPHNDNITRTRWGAFNVLAEYADWGRSVRKAPKGYDGPKAEGVERMRAIGTMVNWPTAAKERWFARLVDA